MAAASLVVIGVVALFLTASSGSTAVSFSLSSYSIPGGNVVMYGAVTDGSHHAVPGAQVEVYEVIHGHASILRQARTSPHGLYRVVLHHAKQVVLHVIVSEGLHGTHYQGSTRFPVRPGGDYHVSAQLQHRGSLFFLPVFSY